MATTHHNISGEATKELLAVGDGVKVTSISLVNLHASITCFVDLYIEKKLTGRFYVIKTVALPVGTTLILEGNDIKLNNNADQFSLFIKLTKSASETPVVDVIIS
tara:strand:- start:349 stop:663 length:315 start_codon:yes stop_codon:yes gene_type:complete